VGAGGLGVGGCFLTFAGFRVFGSSRDLLGYPPRVHRGAPFRWPEGRRQVTGTARGTCASRALDQPATSSPLGKSRITRSGGWCVEWRGMSKGECRRQAASAERSASPARPCFFRRATTAHGDYDSSGEAAGPFRAGRPAMSALANRERCRLGPAPSAAISDSRCARWTGRHATEPRTAPVLGS